MFLLTPFLKWATITAYWFNETENFQIFLKICLKISASVTDVVNNFSVQIEALIKASDELLESPTISKNKVMETDSILKLSAMSPLRPICWA